MEKFVSEAERDFITGTIEGKLAQRRLDDVNQKIMLFEEEVYRYESIFKSCEGSVEKHPMYRDYQLEVRNLNHFLDVRERILLQMTTPKKLTKLTMRERFRSILGKRNAFEKYIEA